MTAAKRAQTMNASMNVLCLEQLLGPATENVFNDNFWTGLDVVCNALDNMDARKYSDSRCVFFHKVIVLLSVPP